MSEANGRHDLMQDGPLLSLEQLRILVGRKYGVKRTWHRWFAWQRTDKNPKTGEYMGGARSHNGERVFLESTYAGSCVIHSTEAAWLRFVAKQNEGRE